MLQNKNRIIEFHILQSFPVSCLNRDDVGSPKTAVIGGTNRARISSQCWKRQVRLEMQKLGATVGCRTKLISKLIENECIKQGATQEQAKECSHNVENIFIKKSKNVKNDEGSKKDDDSNEENDGKTDTLLFISPSEVVLIVEQLKNKNFKLTEETKKEILKSIKENKSIDAIDIALFGRMVAQAGLLDTIEASSSFSHAISTHKVSNAVDFFTALDDFSNETGSAHMGVLEFNSATYYRYISLNLGQLKKTLSNQNIKEAIEAFIRALFIAVPSARQSTQSGASPWEFARIYVREGQRLQVPFETAIRQEDGGFIGPSKKYLCDYLDKKEKLYGTMFQKIISINYGDDETGNIDKLVEQILSSLGE